MWERFSALAGLRAHSEFLLYYPGYDEFYVELIYLLAVSGSFSLFSCSRYASRSLDKYEIILINSCGVCLQHKSISRLFVSQRKLLLLIRMKAEGYWSEAVSTVQCVCVSSDGLVTRPGCIPAPSGLHHPV